MININTIQRNGEKVKITGLNLCNTQDQDDCNCINVLDLDDVKSFLEKNAGYKLVDVNLIDQTNQNSDGSSITLLLTFKPESHYDTHKKVSVSCHNGKYCK